MRYMNRFKFLALLSVFLPTLVLAQPPEEVPPPPPEMPEEEMVEQAPPPPIPAAPVAEPAAVAAPKAAEAEDKSVKGVTVDPGVGVYPLGYDKIDIGDGSPEEGGRYFFTLKPKIDIGANFKTSKGKPVSTSVGFAMTWREYYNKATTQRDFDNDLTGNISVDWTDRFSTSVDGEFEYFYKAGTDSNEDNNIFILAQPMAKFKINDALSLSGGYQFIFLNLFDTRIGAGNLDTYSDPPADIDDISGGSPSAAATVYDIGSDPYGINSGSGVEESQWLAYNRITLGVGYKVTKSTSLDFKYQYGIHLYSNKDSSEQAWEQLFIPKISQSLPWNGGKISLSDEFRLRKAAYALAKGSTSPKQTLRNRITLAINQPITDIIEFELWYRMDVNGSNDDNYGNLSTYNKFYLGMNFSF